MSSKIDELFSQEKSELPHVKCYLTPEKHDAFRKLCKSKKKKMSEVLNALIDDLLERENKVVPISSVPQMLKSAGDTE